MAPMTPTAQPDLPVTDIYVTWSYTELEDALTAVGFSRRDVAKALRDYVWRCFSTIEEAYPDANFQSILSTKTGNSVAAIHIADDGFSTSLPEHATWIAERIAGVPLTV